MQQTRLSGGIGCFVAILLLCLAPSSALLAQGQGGYGGFDFEASKEVHCDTPGGDLQNELTTAPSGMNIWISGSCNAGPYTIRKAVKLLGRPGAVLSASAESGYVLRIEQVSVRMYGLTIDAQGASQGVQLVGSALTGSNVTIQNAQHAGLFVGLNSSAELYDFSFLNNGFGITLDSSSAYLYSTLVQGSRHGGIETWQSSSLQLVNSRVVSGSRDGLVLNHLSTAHVDNSVIRDNAGTGVWIARNASVRFWAAPSTVENNGVDVRCDLRGMMTFDPSLISSTKTFSSDSTCSVENAPFAP